MTPTMYRHAMRNNNNTLATNSAIENNSNNGSFIRTVCNEHRHAIQLMHSTMLHQCRIKAKDLEITYAFNYLTAEAASASGPYMRVVQPKKAEAKIQTHRDKR